MNDKDRMAREKMEALNEKNLTKGGVNALTREIEYLRKQVELEKSNIVNLIREKDMMKRKIIQAEGDNNKNKENLIKQMNEISQLKELNKQQSDQLEEMLKNVGNLSKERDKFSHEASKANANLM